MAPTLHQHVAGSDMKKKKKSSNLRSKTQDLSYGVGYISPGKSSKCEEYDQKIFSPHLSLETALKTGDAFKAVLRVNAHNTSEGYCTIDGVPVDILIDGLASQNRAVEGDIVAIKVDPFSCWTKMKGSAGQYIASASAESNVMTVNISGRAKHGIIEQGLNAMNISSRETKDKRNGGGDGSQLSCNDEQTKLFESLRKINCNISSSPFKRPTGKVVSILEKSSLRDSIIGSLRAKEWFHHNICFGKGNFLLSDIDCIELTPSDPKLSQMMVPIQNLPSPIQKRLLNSDMTLEMELVAAKMEDWSEEEHFPRARVFRTFGKAGQIDTHVASILFQNNISCSEFSAESLSCLPDVSWSLSPEELKARSDIRNKCIFTIDPPTATDLDDALSCEKLSNGNFSVGVHIADVSHFVLPDSALDKDAKERSTSVYMLQQKIPMLPPLISDDIGSLNPGVDRLAFTIFWEISPDGSVMNRWIGRTVIRSCCKLSYAHAQDIIESEDLDTAAFPSLHGDAEWPEIIRTVKNLYKVSNKLKEKRFVDGALKIDENKLTFLFDDFGIPYDVMMRERNDAECLVEEFMLLANISAAEVISQAYPDNALLRRHPKPNTRKLKEFEAFCKKHGFDVDVSSSGLLNQSLERIKEKIGDDRTLFDIILNKATKSMQLAAYFSTGDDKIDVLDWGHYALAVPVYTHFTSPLRRYPDILVHRTLAAVIQAEVTYSSKQHPSSEMVNNVMNRCFTGALFDKIAADSTQGKDALSAASLKHKVPHAESLFEVAAHCNRKRKAGKGAQDACHQLYMWILLKNKQMLVSEARVLGLGPKFMSVYIEKLAIEQRIYYNEVKGLNVEWLAATSTLVLSYSSRRFNMRVTPRMRRPLEEVAVIYRAKPKKRREKLVNEPSVLPLTIHIFSTIPVALFAVGEENGHLEIEAKLYLRP